MQIEAVSPRAWRRGLDHGWEAAFATLMFCALGMALLTAEPDVETVPPDAFALERPAQCGNTHSSATVITR